jgi:ribose 5-phosphate isomerase B
MTFIVAVGADDAGVHYKDTIVADLERDPRVERVIDLGVRSKDDPSYYPHIAVAVSELVAAGEADRAVLVCGTGMGMAISANKVPGVRASTAHDGFSVERLVKSNDGQVLCLGARVIGIEVARRLVGEFLSYSFDPSSASAAKVEAICSYEKPH